MRIAKDGKPFDVDNFDELDELEEGEVEIIQFMRPNGKRRRMASNVGKDVAKLAENQILSAEELTTGEVAIYSRLIGEDEEQESMKLAENSAGDKNPTAVLISLIKEKSNKGE